MNEIKVWNYDGSEVRTIEKDGEPWFVGKDICDVLGYVNARKAIGDHVDDEDKGVTKCDTLGGVQKLNIINESGVYALIFGSKLPDAKKFKRWVTSEVLPSIRKTGYYGNNVHIDELNEIVNSINDIWEDIRNFYDRCYNLYNENDSMYKCCNNKINKNKTTQWFLKMKPKYKELMSFYDCSRSKLYSEIFKKLENMFNIDINEIHEKYCDKNGISLDDCYIFDAIEDNVILRNAVEYIVNLELVKNGLKSECILKRNKNETIFDY